MNARRDRGASDALGLALLAPAAIALAFVIIFVGRSIDGRATAQSAAEAAAQAAAQERTPAAARAAAERIGVAMLTDSSSCASPKLAVDVGDFRPGGIVSVTVACTATTDDLTPLGSTTHTSTATAFARVDPFRGTEVSE